MSKRKFSSISSSVTPSSSSSVAPSSSSSVAPSSSSHNWIHDVFPSFRGEDVRVGFLSHIQKEFKRKLITPFIDNEIKRGESIAPELIQAIRGSKIAIILLSKNYASSKWCLNELVEIMNCRKELGQTVMVIFYKVDPSDVKKLAGHFGKVFKNTCVGKSKEVIKKWKEALTEVATIAGYHSINWNNEAEMIEKIATDVSDVLMNSAPSNDFNSLIGMRGHMENIEPFLRLDSDEVRMIGIWGPSGIGKTTIARFLYSNYAHHFQISVFMDDIKRRIPRPYYNDYNAKLQLQQEFLSIMVNQEDLKINHLGVLQDRLKDKRVLVVLDDVDHLLQLDAMARETRWFGLGSRIIITTQDKNILKQHRINQIYEVGFPPDDEALQIFCMNAFGESSPYEGFGNLAREATKLCGNLPLGLKVMGSHFKGMDKHEWEKELSRLRNNLNGEIESILKFSYDVLLEEDKGLFLYIACFFHGESIERIEAYLATNFSDVSRGIQVLAEKSLISINESDWRPDYINMHDLLRHLGREIVRKQSIQKLEKRQFLLDAKDICQVLSNDTVVNRSVIGIKCEHFKITDELYKSDRVLDRMHSLQFLRIHFRESNYYNGNIFTQSLYHLPPKVKLLHWKYFPMKSLPPNFNPECLVELNMCSSKLEKLWEGIKMIQNLHWIELSFSYDLKKLPDLSTATNLKTLKLFCCSSLVELPSSIGNAINLKELDLQYCISLVELPSSIGNATNLEILNLSLCSNLMELPSSIGNVINLKILNLSFCSNLMELPSPIGNAINLEILNIWGCSNLVELPSSIGNAINLTELNLSYCSSLVELPSSIGNAIKLKKLNLMYCSSLVELPSSIGNAIKLKKLNLMYCSSLVKLPSSIGNATNLKELDLEYCTSLVKIPSSIGNAINLEILNLGRCSSLVELPSSIGNAINLKKLNLSGFLNATNLKEFPHIFDFITELNLSDTRIQEIAPWIKGMSRLHKLVIKGCKKLVSLPELPESLAVIDAENCESLESLNCSFLSSNELVGSINFSNCFKLNQEARDLIMTSTCRIAVLPGDKVPTNFTYRAIGSSLSMTLNGIDKHLPKSLRFKVCFLLVKKDYVEVDDKNNSILPYCYVENWIDYNVLCISKRFHDSFLNEHLYIFDVGATVFSSICELVFKFETNDEKWKIGGCGLYVRTL